ncbi:hypothetical protein [Comamonas serinivorans]|uniref:hypothetical protein n=1 Tax=Comamonas serinivorans TaxID=1082851 RepID=UPI0012FA393C|nr:hypothetical protein [Comamonas serinivorans]
MRFTPFLIGPLAPPVGPSFTLTIASSVYAPNIRALAIAAGWDEEELLVVNITAPIVGALNLGSTPFPGGVTLNIGASSTILGRRGAAGRTGAYHGTAGGPALTTRVFVTVNNAGEIAGGGGGGGMGATVGIQVEERSRSVVGGNGGAGAGLELGGTTQMSAQSGVDSGPRQWSYSSITFASGWAEGGDGGDGGGLGEAGAQGTGGSFGGDVSSYSRSEWGFGAAAGAAVDGNSYVTWQSAGTRRGALIN